MVALDFLWWCAVTPASAGRVVIMTGPEAVETPRGDFGVTWHLMVWITETTSVTIDVAGAVAVAVTVTWGTATLGKCSQLWT